MFRNQDDSPSTSPASNLNAATRAQLATQLQTRLFRNNLNATTSTADLRSQLPPFPGGFASIRPSGAARSTTSTAAPRPTTTNAPSFMDELKTAVNKRRQKISPNNTSSTTNTTLNNQNSNVRGVKLATLGMFVNAGRTNQASRTRQGPTIKPQNTAVRKPSLTSAQRERRKEYIRAFANPEGKTPDVLLNYIELDPGFRLSPYGLNYQEAVELGLIDPNQGTNWNLYGGMNIPAVSPIYYVPTATGYAPQMITAAAPFAGGRSMTVSAVPAGTVSQNPPVGVPTQGFWTRATSGLKKFGKGVTSWFGGRSTAVPAISAVPALTLPNVPVVGGRSQISPPAGDNLRPSVAPGVWKKFLTRAQSTWNTAKTAGKELVTIGGRGLNTAGRAIGRGIKKAGLAGYDVITGTALPSFITGTGESLRNVKQKIFAGGRSMGVQAVPAISIAPTRVTGLNPQGEQYNPFGDSEYEKILAGFESSPIASVAPLSTAEKRIKEIREARLLAEKKYSAERKRKIKEREDEKRSLARKLAEEAANLSPESRAQLENFFRMGIKDREERLSAEKIQRINKEYLERALREEAIKRRAAEVEGMPSGFNLSPDYEEARRNIYLRPEDESLFKSIARKAALNIKPKAQKGAAAALSRRLSAEDRERRKNEFMKNKLRLQEVQNMSPLGLRNSPDLEEASRIEIKRKLKLNKLYDDKRKDLDQKINLLKGFMKTLRDSINGNIPTNYSQTTLKNKLDTTKPIHDNLNDKYLIAKNYFDRNEVFDAIKTLDNALQEYNNVVPTLITF